MKNHLLLVDYENAPKVDLSGLDDTYRAIIFVGATLPVDGGYSLY